MTKEHLINLLKTKDPSEIDLTGIDLVGIKSNLRHVDKNEIIYKSGDSANSIYFIVKGEVMLTKGDDIKTVGEKEYFGLEAINPNKKQMEKAIAIKKGIILELILQDKSSPKISTEVGKLSANQFLSKPSKKSKKPSTKDNDVSSHRDYINENVDDVLYIKIKIKKAILTHSKSFLNHMNKAIDSGNKKFIVDLTYCDIIDSTFLGVLVKTLKIVSSQNGEIVLIYDKSQSSTLFMITYMDKVFKIFEDKEKALAYFKSKSEK